MIYIKSLSPLVLIIFITAACIAQNPLHDSSAYITISAGTEYKKSRTYQWLWGKNRRIEWTTPVRVPVGVAAVRDKYIILNAPDCNEVNDLTKQKYISLSDSILFLLLSKHTSI
ncbi:MAG: hypothetical protein ABIN97_20930 [Ginsengibacter sp.]